ncbi:MAG TPA: phospholipase [Ramlibacter sp.]|nr:phospholipase [Ramlibacter sp.]
MTALRIYAGPRARQHLQNKGLQPGDVGIVPGAAGGPKGLVLGPLDRFVFGEWLAKSNQPVDVVGASIGAWRMATACMKEPISAFSRLERDYISQDYELPPGRKMPLASHVSERFSANLDSFFGGRIREVLDNPRYKLHIVTSRGRHVLGREHKVATPLGYLGAFLSNALHRRVMGAWLERVVFSTTDKLPFGTGDYRTRRIALGEANFNPALQASCSIPFVLKAVHDIPGAPPGAYWDGGITDYHLHLDYDRAGQGPIVLYPHFQKAIVPGWLDKGFKWRHGATHFLDNTIVLAPDREWIAGLPNAKLPDRTDFPRYGTDLKARVTAWSTAASAAAQLADEFQQWLEKPDLSRVEAL